MSITILICTHGPDYWRQLALERAYPSAVKQEGANTYAYHQQDATLAHIRNKAAETTTSDWLCFLDADDELSPTYIQAMEAQIEARSGGGTELGLAHQVAKESLHHNTPGDAEAQAPVASDRKKCLLIPTVQYVSPAGVLVGEPHVPNMGRWPQLNVGVVGTLVPRDLFVEVGGFGEWKSCEDWDLWLRCWDAGAELVYVPDAVYVAHMSARSRNSVQSDYGRIWAEHESRVSSPAQVTSPPSGRIV